MATFKTFEEIEAWKKARELTKRVYRASGKGSFARDFGLRDQIRRASVSIMSNIAEGHDRSGTGEFIQFLAVATGSASEVRSQLYVAVDQNYIGATDFDQLSELVAETGRMIGGLMKYLAASGYRGLTVQVQNKSEALTNVKPRTRNSELGTRNLKLGT